MKHTPVINHNRATCSCGNLPAIWRRDSEPIGKFTLRAHECFLIHRSLAPADAAGDLFDFRQPEPERAPDLFGGAR